MMVHEAPLQLVVKGFLPLMRPINPATSTINKTASCVVKALVEQLQFQPCFGQQHKFRLRTKEEPATLPLPAMINNLTLFDSVMLPIYLPFHLIEIRLSVNYCDDRWFTIKRYI